MRTGRDRLERGLEELGRDEYARGEAKGQTGPKWISSNAHANAGFRLEASRILTRFKST